MTDLEYKIIKIKLSLKTTIKRGNLGPVWDKPVPDRWFCFWPNILSIYCWSLVAIGEFTFQKLVTNQLFGLEFCALQRNTFHPHQDYEQVTFYEKSSLRFFGWSVRNWKVAACLQLAEKWNISTKFWQKLLFFINIPNLFRMLFKKKLKILKMCKE